MTRINRTLAAVLTFCLLPPVIHADDEQPIEPAEVNLGRPVDFKQDIHPINARFKMTQATGQTLTRVAINVLTIVEVKAADIKPHDKYLSCRKKHRSEWA